MLRNLSDLHGRTLGATDGPIGHVKDFYFDDTSWVIRYVVADTGNWLPGRLVLLPPRVFGDDALGPVDASTAVLAVHLSRHRIETSPSIDAHRPVSRQTEVAYYSHFGWPAYWPDFGIGVIAGIPAVKLPPVPGHSLHHGHLQRDDVHLRSTGAVTGYHLQATDGPIGTVRGFLMDAPTWTLRELLVDTGPWYAPKLISVPTVHVTRLDHATSAVHVDLSLLELRQTHRHEVAHLTPAID